MPQILAHKSYRSRQCCGSRIRFFVHPGSGFFSHLESRIQQQRKGKQISCTVYRYLRYLSPRDINFTIWKLFNFSTGAGKGLIQLTKHSGSDFFPSRIPDPNFLYPGSASKNLSILAQKNGFQALGNTILVVHPGSRILFTHPDSGSRGQKGTGSRIRNND